MTGLHVVRVYLTENIMEESFRIRRIGKLSSAAPVSSSAVSMVKDTKIIHITQHELRDRKIASSRTVGPYARLYIVNYRLLKFALKVCDYLIKRHVEASRQEPTHLSRLYESSRELGDINRLRTLSKKLECFDNEPISL